MPYSNCDLVDRKKDSFEKMKEMLTIFLIFGLCSQTLAAWGFGSKDPGKVLLRDVQVLTLKNGQMTTGRRSSPVQQLKCVGGSAQGQFNPAVVQCYNRGWDGQDVQWECKTGMSTFRLNFRHFLILLNHFQTWTICIDLVQLRLFVKVTITPTTLTYSKAPAASNTPSN